MSIWPLIKQSLRRPYALTNMFLFDPREVLRKWRGVPSYIRNARSYQRKNTNRAFDIHASDLWYQSHDRFGQAASVQPHYFHQDLWAATRLYEAGVRKHVDVGSRLDGFVAHLLPFCRVCYVDVRPLQLSIPNLRFARALVTALPFASNALPSVSCLHVLEHVGLGRYGDSVDPDAYVRAAAELARVVRPGGVLLLSTPVGRERMCFDAHRVFDPGTIVGLFRDLRLSEFAFIDDVGEMQESGATLDCARRCTYGCGLFRFVKPQAN